MSADNFIGVVKTAKGYFVTEGSMSVRIDYEDHLEGTLEHYEWEGPAYVGHAIAGPFEIEDEASAFADMTYLKETIVEYGIISMELRADENVDEALKIGAQSSE